MDGSTHIERAYVSGGSRGHNAQIESEWREKRNAFNKIGLAAQALLTALEDLPRPLYADEVETQDMAAGAAACKIADALDDMVGDVMGAFLKRVSAAGLDRDDYNIALYGVRTIADALDAKGGA